MLYMPDLTRMGARILGVLRDNGDWMTRADIAAKMGKSRLNPNDLKQLEGLVSDGLVERDSEVVGISPQYLYRSTS
jgi:hypothetical protein